MWLAHKIYRVGESNLGLRFFAILLRKRFEGLGSLGSGRCGAAALSGNCCRTKAEVLLLQVPPGSAKYHSTWCSTYLTCTSLYISALAGCIKSISGGWGWMSLGLVRMSTSSVGPNLPTYRAIAWWSVPPLFPLVLSLTGIHKHKVLSSLALSWIYYTFHLQLTYLFS